MSNDLSRKKELNDAASELLDNIAFRQAVLDLRKRYWDELMTASTTEAKIEIIARAKALESIPAELTVLVNNYKMATRKHAS